MCVCVACRSDQQWQQDQDQALPVLPTLPEAVLVSILQQVHPLKARLANCALVCKAWAAAVAATTAHLDAGLSSCIRWQHVQDYLDLHAGQVGAPGSLGIASRQQTCRLEA